MIREVAYYQAVCDMCGAVDDGGAYSAWAEPDHARMEAMESGWEEVQARCDDTETGGGVYQVTPPDGSQPYSYRSILICEDHPRESVLWCRDCDKDLAEDAWNMTSDGHAEQACPDGHWNAIRTRTAP